MLSEIDWAFPRQRKFRKLGRILGGFWIIFADFRRIWVRVRARGRSRANSGIFVLIRADRADYAEFIAEIWGVRSGSAENNFGGFPSAKFARP